MIPQAIRYKYLYNVFLLTLEEVTQKSQINPSFSLPSKDQEKDIFNEVKNRVKDHYPRLSSALSQKELSSKKTQISYHYQYMFMESYLEKIITTNDEKDIVFPDEAEQQIIFDKAERITRFGFLGRLANKLA